MIKIDIRENCIKCEKCVAVCPVSILSQDPKDKTIFVKRVTNCIECGQCAAVCPTRALQHSSFPATSIIDFTKEECPTIEHTMLLLKKRRSNRTFSSKEIPAQDIAKIVEAAYQAPTAHNSRDLAFTVISSPEKLKELTDFTIETYENAIKKLTNPLLKPFLKLKHPKAYHFLPLMQRLSSAYRRGNDAILRKATSVVLLHTKENDSFSLTNCNLAYQNASLMSETLGISQFYIGFLCKAIQLAPGSLEKRLGIKGHIQAAMALGLPKIKFEKYIDRGTPQYKTL